MKTIEKNISPFLLILCLLTISTRGLAQFPAGNQFLNGGQPSLRAYERAAQKAFKKKDYYAALQYFESAVSLDKSKIENYYQLAESARLFGANSIARNAYKKVVELDSTNLFPKAGLYYGISEKNLGNYETAESIIYKFIGSPFSADYGDLADNEKSDLQYIFSEKPDLAEGEIEVLCLDSTINTKYSEVSPVWRNEELYYASLRYDKLDDEVIPPRKLAKTLYSNLSKEGRLWEGMNLPNKTTAHFSFTQDDSRMYFSVCDYNEQDKMECQLYYRDRINDDWGLPIPLPSHINSKGTTTTHPAIGLNEYGQKVLFFVSDRPLGKGGLDIWYSPIISQNDFGEPVNLQINTNENDITPFFHYPTNALYFSSEGHISYGGYDVYKINRMEEGRWTSINYLPDPINTSYNDFNYFLDKEGVRGFLVSNRENCVFLENLEWACNDIFLVNHGTCPENTTELLVNVFDAEIESSLVGASATIRDWDMVFVGLSEEDNRLHFSDLLITGERQVYIEREGYISDTVRVNLVRCKPQEISVYLRKKPCPDTTVIVQLFDGNTKQKLNGGIVTILEGEESSRQENPDGNEFTFSNIFKKEQYKLVVERTGYISQEIERILEPCKTAQVPINLVRSNPEFDTIACYFDNDIPKRKIRGVSDPSCDLAYNEFYFDYRDRNAYYQKRFMRGEVGAKRDQHRQEVINFFSEKVDSSFTILERFKNDLLAKLKILPDGETYIINIKGYTSNLASKAYNDELAQRRINSVKNYFIKTHGADFNEYLFEKKSLIFEEIPLGEVGPGFDKPKDYKNTIYNPVSAIKRRVEIIRVSGNMNQSISEGDR